MKSVRGTAMLESVIFLPVILLLIIAAVQFYLLFTEFYVMVQAAREMVLHGSNLARPIGADCNLQACTLGTLTEADYLTCINSPLDNPNCVYTVMCWTGEQIINTRRRSYFVSSPSLEAELAWYSTSGGNGVAPLLVKAKVSGTFQGLFSFMGGIPLTYQARGGYLARYYGCGATTYTFS